MAVRTGAAAIPIHHTEVDGIQCVWAELPGELSATLTFRVGAADETLATRGITHMVEHLATPPDDWTPYDVHGGVTGLTTTFDVRGDPDHVVAGLADLARRLVDVELDRLPLERRILVTEDWSPGLMPTLARIRYGARGPGLEGYEELGVRRVSAEEILAWARRFSAGNAMLWLTGPPPLGLRCPLLDGPRLQCPALDHRELPLPMLSEGDDGVWGLSFLTAPPTGGDHPAFEILRERLLRLLRARHGITYSIERRKQPLAALLDHRYIGGDVLLGYEELALELVLGELAELAENGPTDEEIEIAKIWSRRYAGSVESLDSWMVDWIDSVLLGRPAPTIGQWLDDVEQMTTDDVADSIARISPTLLVASGAQADAERLGLGRFEGAEDEPLAGTEFLPLPQVRWPGVALVVGPDGISYTADGSTTTYAVGALEVMTQEGTDRTLIRTDGASLELSLEDWQDGRALWSLLDDVVPRDRVVDLDVQGPEEPYLRPR
jgi:hypothetical protein